MPVGPPLVLGEVLAKHKEPLDMSFLVLGQRRIESRRFYLSHLQPATPAVSFTPPKDTKKPTHRHGYRCHFLVSRELGHGLTPSESNPTYRAVL